MNTGQLLLTLCAMFLLSTVILRVNDKFLSTGDLLNTTKMGVVGVSLGTSLIEEANSQAFDNNTDTTAVKDLSVLTSPYSLGQEVSDSVKNDFDDYNNYIRTDSIPGIGIFDISSKVYYIAASNLKVKSTVRTWHKLIEVKIKNRTNPKDSLMLSSIFSYWFFR